MKADNPDCPKRNRKESRYGICTYDLFCNMKIKRLLSLYRSVGVLWIAAFFLVVSCKDSGKNDSPEPTNVYLVGDSALADLSKEVLADRIRSYNPLFSSLVKNGVKVHRLTYKTRNTDGKEIIASGAIIIPSTTEQVSMISVQHGTITDKRNAPSYFNPNSDENTFGALFSGLGYIIVFPDYIGYGASEAYPHPYEHRASLASASLDMLRASKEFLAGRKEVKWNNKLYIAGYSEGGFATLSLQKKIEEEASSEFNLRASSCGAGAYDKTSFMNYIINNATVGIPSYNSLYLWVLLTYDRIYGLNKPASYYFKSSYASAIQNSGKDVTINASFNTIFLETFVKGINDKTDQGFLNAVADNNVYDWKPVTPTKLFHGDADKLVFYFNSENAFKAMKARGATNVSLETLKGKDHSTAVNDFLLNTYTFFNATP